MNRYINKCLFFILVSGLIGAMEKQKYSSIIAEYSGNGIDDIAFVGNDLLLLHRECWNGSKDFFTQTIHLLTHAKYTIATGRLPVMNSTYLRSAVDKKSVMYEFTLSKNQHAYVVCGQDNYGFHWRLSELRSVCEWPPHGFGDRGALISDRNGNEVKVYRDEGQGVWSEETKITSFIKNNPGLFIIKYLPGNKVLCQSINSPHGYYFYDLKEKLMLDFIHFENAPAYHIECSSDGSFIGINHYQKISILSLKKRQKKLLTIDQDKNHCIDSVRSAAEFHPHNGILAWLYKNTISYWDVCSGEKYHIEHVYNNEHNDQDENILNQKMREPKRGISFSADGSKIAGLFGNMCVIFNVPQEVRYGLSYRKLCFIYALRENLNNDLVDEILSILFTMRP